MPCDRTMSEALIPTPGESGCTSLALTREVTCLRALAWRCDLPAAIDWSALVRELAVAGLVPRATLGGLLRLANATQDEVVLVPASGRVQLRVHYMVPQHERRFAAERLFQLLVRALLRLGRAGSGVDVKAGLGVAQEHATDDQRHDRDDDRVPQPAVDVARRRGDPRRDQR